MSSRLRPARSETAARPRAPLYRPSLSPRLSGYERQRTALLRYFSDRCIEQAAPLHTRFERCEGFRRYRYQQSAARLRVTHQCELGTRHANIDALLKRLHVPHRAGGTESARQVVANVRQDRNRARANLGTDSRAGAHYDQVSDEAIAGDVRRRADTG